jgi:hypothetical protein
MPLSTSEKIRLLREIGERLGAEDWSLVDLTLRQFGFPTTDQWEGGSRENYVLKMIEAEDEGRVLALGEHVGVEFATRAVRIDPPFWTRGCLRLFISHISTQKSYVSAFRDALAEFGISGFVAHEDIAPSAEWEGEIETALTTMDAMTALLNPGFHASCWTDQEVGHAIGRGIPVFAVRCGEDPYGFMGRLQALSGFGKSPEALARELFDVIVRHKQTSRRLAEALIELLKNSNTFARAKWNIGLLEEATYWHPNFAAELRSAIKNNDQVESSWGVPARIDRLIAKHT